MRSLEGRPSLRSARGTTVFDIRNASGSGFLRRRSSAKKAKAVTALDNVSTLFPTNSTAALSLYSMAFRISSVFFCEKISEFDCVSRRIEMSARILRREGNLAMQ